MDATLTSKGQLTLPKAVREALQLKPGVRFTVHVKGDSLELTPIRVNALAVRGLLKSPHTRTLSLEEMDDAVARTLSAKHARGKVAR